MERKKRPILDTNRVDITDQVWDFIVRDSSSARPAFQWLGFAGVIAMIVYIIVSLIIGGKTPPTETENSNEWSYEVIDIPAWAEVTGKQTE